MDSCHIVDPCATRSYGGFDVRRHGARMGFIIVILVWIALFSFFLLQKIFTDCGCFNSGNYCNNESEGCGKGYNGYGYGYGNNWWFLIGGLIISILLVWAVGYCGW